MHLTPYLDVAVQKFLVFNTQLSGCFQKSILVTGNPNKLFKSSYLDTVNIGLGVFFKWILLRFLSLLLPC